jgi:hypothetical protein
MPPSHFLFFYFFIFLKKDKYAGVAKPPQHISFFSFFFWFLVFCFFGFFKKTKIKYVIGAFWERNGQSG